MIAGLLGVRFIFHHLAFLAATNTCTVGIHQIAEAKTLKTCKAFDLIHWDSKLMFA